MLAAALAGLLPLLFMRTERPFARRVSLSLLLAACASVIALAGRTGILNRPVDLLPWHLPGGIEFSFHLDRLSALFVGIIGVVGACFSIYSFNYVEHGESNPRRNFLVATAPVFLLSMVLFVGVSDMVFQLLFWELMSITSFFLVMLGDDVAEIRKAGLFYFVMTQLSTLFLMFAFLLMYHQTGSFALTTMTGATPALRGVVFVALLLGFGTKAGLMPFHKWLPYAHAASPSNVSALMSGVMLKVAVYGVVRYLFFVLEPEPWWGAVLLVAGSLSALLGVIYALRETDIKRILAYSSIENIGIIFIGLGLSLVFRTHGLADLALFALLAALFHAASHALFKSLLFMGAGSVIRAVGSRNIEKMGGLVKTMPVTAVLFLVGSAAIAALPPLNGFVGELMIFQSFTRSFSLGDPSAVLLLFAGLSLFALTSALAAACFVKLFGLMFLARPRSEAAADAHEVPAGMLIGPGILAALCIALGVGSYQVFTGLGYQPPLPNLLVVSLALAGFAAVIATFVYLASNRQSRVVETWACGLPPVTARMEYSAAGFSEPILTVFKWLYRTSKLVQRDYYDKQSSLLKRGFAELRTFNFFEQRLYLPVARFVQRVSGAVSRKHDADLDTFILYAFLAILALLLMVGWML
jgi:hydrogenase-4 component B